MLQTKFSADDLITILEQAAIYDCACPAQVCKEIRSLRSLYGMSTSLLQRDWPTPKWSVVWKMFWSWKAGIVKPWKCRPACKSV